MILYCTNTSTGMMGSITITIMMELMEQGAMHTGMSTHLKNTLINTGPICTIGIIMKMKTNADHPMSGGAGFVQI